MFLFYIRVSEESLRLHSTAITMQGNMGDWSRACASVGVFLSGIVK